MTLFPYTTLFRSVEKSFLIHSPLVEKIEIVHRAKVRRKNLSFLRERSGKSARLTNKAFDRNAVNNVEAAEEVLEAEVNDPETQAEKVNPKGAGEPEE